MTIKEYYGIMADLNCAIVETDLPMASKGFTLKNECEYVVYLNNNYSAEVMKETLDHEISHIVRGDFNGYY